MHFEVFMVHRFEHWTTPLETTKETTPKINYRVGTRWIHARRCLLGMFEVAERWHHVRRPGVDR